MAGFGGVKGFLYLCGVKPNIEQTNG